MGRLNIFLFFTCVLSLRLLGQVPVLKIEHSVKVEFPTQTGYDYTVYSTTDPNQQSGWKPLGLITHATGENVVFFHETNLDQKVFFKVESELSSGQSQAANILPVTKLSTGETYPIRVEGFSDATGRIRFLITEPEYAEPTTPTEDSYTIPDLDLEMMPIPAGTFVMGSPSDEVDRYDDEGPQVTVNITKSFWMGKTEVTQSQWKSVMGNNPSHFKGENLPVESVSWNDAMTFCEKLNELYSDILPEGYQYALPTEAQWEYACRAGTTFRFFYGDDPGYDQLEHYAWYSNNSEKKTHLVGEKPPNAWGLYDMHGNVWELCSDYYSSSYPLGSISNPQGPQSGSYRVERGGCWRVNAAGCRSANRNWHWPVFTDSNLGVRVALIPVPSE